MRFLHTSDWHLGRTLHGVDLAEAQRVALDAICRQVEDPWDRIAIDAVLISGDVYDRAVAPVESMDLLARTLERLVRHTTVVLISGNHDSARRLGFGAGLFTDRLHVVTDINRVGEPILLTGADGTQVAVYALPYLEPDDARAKLATGDELPARSHQGVVDAAMTRVRADLASRQGVRSVVMAHAFVTDAAPSESERGIAVGGVEHVCASSFDGTDYVALGHLHRPQAVPSHANSPVLRYSGSPLRYSFGEAGHDKSVLLVDVPTEGPVVVDEVSLPQPRAMADLTGTMEDLLTNPAHAVHEQSWLRVTVTDDVRPERLMSRIRERFPHAIQIMHQAADRPSEFRLATTRRSEEDAQELGRDFIEFVTQRHAQADELELFAGAFEHLRRRESA